MAISKGENSYVTLQEAESYFEGRLGADVWNNADVDSRTKALISATRYLEEQPWLGAAVALSQPLAFPRTGYYFEPRLNAKVPITTPESIVPKRVMDATCEVAIAMLETPAAISGDSVSRIDSISVEGIAISGLKDAVKSTVMTPIVSTLLRPLTDSGSVRRSWWRAN